MFQVTRDNFSFYTIYAPKWINIEIYAASYLTWLKFIFDTMLEALALHLHRREDQAVPYEVRRVAHSLASFETANRERIADDQRTSIKTHRRSSRQPSVQSSSLCISFFGITMYFVQRGNNSCRSYGNRIVSAWRNAIKLLQDATPERGILSFFFFFFLFVLT